MARKVHMYGRDDKYVRHGILLWKNLKCRDYFGNLAVDERVMKLILELGRGYGKGVLPQAKVL